MPEADVSQVKALLRHFDPHLRSGGIDEAYLDVTDYMATHALSADQVAPHEFQLLLVGDCCPGWRLGIAFFPTD